MANKMLIDAAHPEETRVVVLRGNRVEDFDFEAASKKPLRGNIYLAKVTRVEPSLQAAFIEYGGNRHGFLAFSEIHPDYYQIPVADRQALLEEDARAHREEEDEQRPGTPRRSRRHRRNGGDKRNAGAEGVTAESEHHDDAHDEQNPFVEDADPAPRAEEEVPVEAASTEETENSQSESADRAPDADDTAPVTDDEPEHDGERHEGPSSAMPMAAHEDAADRVVGEIEADQDTQHDDGGDVEQATAESGAHGGDEEHEEEVVEQLGGDALEDVPYRAPRLRRHYKIQEVIKRRQVLLVQVVKEERGNKGAALTTYLSLAGRYSVLMPNTARGGGISRKITDSDDRKRLKSIAQDLEVPEGMGIILRTAGAARSESEVKRDFEYLLRMWETVRELTLRSSAPTLVYEEGSLIKRAIRDLYSKDIDEVTVSGEDGYREARDFMRLLMPSHAKNVVLYKDPQPIFAKSGAEAQLDAMFSNHVTLKSGGYLVINQTEALVAIDVNSGRSTREHNIEDTALRTNLEAADEVARQLRLRDLAGLIVVDFIDMEEGRNNRAVERRIKDALKNDRARIQIGRISHFGLLEMSRQRIRTGIMEGSTVLCPHCAGAGTVRSTSSIALHVLRVLEDNLIRSAAYNLIVRTRIEVALYILNQKRAHLTELESRFGASVAVLADASLTGTVYHAIERGEPATPPAVVQAKHPGLGQDETPDTEDDEFETESEGDDEDASAERASERGAAEGAARSDDEEGGERRRRRRRRRRGRDRDPRSATGTDADADGEQPSDEGMENMARIGGDLPPIATELPGESAPSVEAGEGTDAAMPIAAEASVSASESSAAVAGGITAAEPVVAKEPTEAPRRRRSRRSAARVGDEAAESAEAAPRAEAETPAPRRSRRSRARVVEDEAPTLLGFEAPSADRDIEADTVKAHTSDAIAEPTLFEAPAPVEHPSEPAPQTLEATASEAPPVADAPAPAPVAAPVETNPEPAAPKRSGWWQRAKATITGE